jgi:hypothetical protein
MKDKIYKSEDIEQLLRNRFSPPAFAFLPQVRNQTGYCRQIRTADVLVMGLYPSRGLYLSGFEIKVNRGDWLNELKHPDKAEAIAQFCDFWWIVAPKDIVKIEELPNNWGLMIPFGTTTKIIRQANLLSPNPIDKPFLAGILRKAQETITPEAELDKARDESYAKGRETERYVNKSNNEVLLRLQQQIKEFENNSGIIFNQWTDAKELGQAVKLVVSGEYLRLKQKIERLLLTSKEITKDIEDKLNGLK